MQPSPEIGGFGVWRVGLVASNCELLPDAPAANRGSLHKAFDGETLGVTAITSRYGT